METILVNDKNLKADEERLNPGHAHASNVLKTVGPVVLAVGGILMLIGLGSFFSSMSNMGNGPPRYFWCAFLGMPVTFVGIVICKIAFLGTVARYMSAETAPVAKDTFNYMADGTKEGVRDIASAIREGITGDVGKETIKCCSCKHLNDKDAQFCDDCGQSFQREKDCPACEIPNDGTAKFCDACGTPF